ncbi:MAG: hypothetical protein HQ568_06265 [Calditrichaeota bacterium]|nr:hypothetical protein [Calditrichota bacterium]
MPNDQVWGNSDTSQNADQDLVTLGNEIIEVVDIDDDERTALKTSNSNAAGLALEVVGKVNLSSSVTIGGVTTLNGEVTAAEQVYATDGLEVTGAFDARSVAVIEGDINIGKSDVDGQINANGSAQTPRKLLFGNETDTSSVELSRTGQTTVIKGALDVDQNANFDGTLQVDGITTLDDDVNVNGNTLFLDSVALYGQVYNAAGQVPGNPSIDFIINGNVVAWVDVNGFHP